ncbi:hypothetical protein K438DRAFT_1762565 [Mycena galopus ATCC 62051]|nr:hypothetical protein K438DRAFT_1762565 [Mycena galopus ATCC 62051]
MVYFGLPSAYLCLPWYTQGLAYVGVPLSTSDYVRWTASAYLRLPQSISVHQPRPSSARLRFPIRSPRISFLHCQTFVAIHQHLDRVWLRHVDRSRQTGWSTLGLPRRQTLGLPIGGTQYSELQGAKRATENPIWLFFSGALRWHHGGTPNHYQIGDHEEQTHENPDWV